MLVTCTAIAGCNQAPRAESDQPGVGNTWPAVRDAVIEEYLKAHPAYAVVQGRHEYDGQLPDWSAAGIAAEIRRLHEWRDRATAVAGLSERDAFERDYLVARLDRDLFWVETAEAPFLNPAWYLDWMIDNLDPAPYLTRNYAPLEVRMRAYVKYARSVQQAASQIRANLRTPLARPLLQRGVSAFRGFGEFYRTDVPKAFAGISDTTLQKEFAAANAGAAKAMADLAAWLESQRSSATASFALGAEKFARMLQMTEGVTTPLAELEAAGRADLERNQQALRNACATYAPGAGVAACIAKMNANKPTGGVVEGARAQLDMLKMFVSDAGVATIPGTGRRSWRKRRRTIATTLPTSIFQVRTRKAFPQRTTLPRPIPRGRRPSSGPTSPDRPIFCSRRCTRYGPAISCSSCTRTAARRSSDGCSSATRSQKDGRITPRR